MSKQDDPDVDAIINRLLEARGSQPGEHVQLTEKEIQYLCTKSREIFLSQPMLLELDAPIQVRPRPNSLLYHLFLIAQLTNASEDLWRSPRPVLRPPAPARMWRASTRCQLPFPGRLCRSRETVNRDNVSPAGIQDQIPGKLLPSSGKP